MESLTILAGPMEAKVRLAWDDLLLEHGGSPFQSSGFCDSFESGWLGRNHARHIAVIRGAGLAAAVPAYLCEACPRLDYYRKAWPGQVMDEPILLSHALVGWHGFPMGRTREDRRLAIERFVAEAAKERAVAMFAGVPADRESVIEDLKGLGFELAVFHTAMVRDLTGFRGDDSTLGLPRNRRARVRNELSRGRKAGTLIRRAECRDHAAILRLLANVLERKETPREVLPDGFVKEILERSPRGLEVYVATDPRDDPIGVHINFAWGDSYTIWLAGHDYDSLKNFRQSHALYVNSVNRAMSLGCRLVEGGRDPYPVKRQHGFEPIRLLCAARGSGPSQHRKASEWIRFLQERHFRKHWNQSPPPPQSLQG